MNDKLLSSFCCHAFHAMVLFQRLHRQWDSGQNKTIMEGFVVYAKKQFRMRTAQFYYPIPTVAGGRPALFLFACDMTAYAHDAFTPPQHETI